MTRAGSSWSRTLTSATSTARLGDTLEVTSEVEDARTVKVTLRQRVLKEGTILVDALLTFACIDQDGKPLRLPPVFSSRSAS